MNTAVYLANTFRASVYYARFGTPVRVINPDDKPGPLQIYIFSAGNGTYEA